MSIKLTASPDIVRNSPYTLELFKDESDGLLVDLAWPESGAYEVRFSKKWGGDALLTVPFGAFGALASGGVGWAAMLTATQTAALPVGQVYGRAWRTDAPEAVAICRYELTVGD